MKRVMRRRPEPGNLDSFLDIMTNVVGVLVFVLLFVTLAAADATVLVRTPLRSETDKQPVYFEASGGRVIYLEPEGREQVASFAEALPRINLYNYGWVLDRIEAFETRTDNYDVDITGGFGIRWRARPGAGESAKEIKDSASEYQRVIASLDPDTAYVAFIVRPDGIEAFRAARQAAARRHLESGWEPFLQDRDLVFGSGGRSVGVQ